MQSQTQPEPLDGARTRVLTAVATAGWIAVSVLTVLGLVWPSLRVLTGLVVSGLIAGTATMSAAAVAMRERIEENRIDAAYSDVLAEQLAYRHRPTAMPRS